MSRALSTERLDEVAAQAIAGVQAEAERLQQDQLTFSTMMDEVEKVPMHRRRYTAAEFFLRVPEKFRAVIGYIAEGRGQLWIADRVGCSHHTVRACRDHFPKAVAIEKERLAERLQAAGAGLVERILENPDVIPPSALAISAGILIDKALLLRGGATIITEHRHVFTHEDYNALVAGAIDVEATASPIGLPAEESGQRADLPAAAPAELAAPGAATPPAGMDSESLALPGQAERAATSAATDEPDSRLGPGEGGVATAKAGGASDVA